MSVALNDNVPAAGPALPMTEGDWRLLHDLRAAVAARIERDIAILDALDGDLESEPEPGEDAFDAELTAAEWAGRGAHRFNRGEVA